MAVEPVPAWGAGAGWHIAGKSLTLTLAPT